MVFRERPLAHERRGHRRAKEFGDLTQNLGRLGGNNAAARENNGPVGRQKQLDRLGDVGGIAVGARCGPAFLAVIDDHVSGLGLDVLWHVDEHGTHAAFQHAVEGLLHHVRDLLDVARVEPPLHHRFSHPREVVRVGTVELLKHSTAHHVGVNATRNDELREGVGESRCDTGQGVRCTRTDRGHDRRDLA
ncbi:hypothetical protein D9M72_482230 [compost metagenome]